MKHTTVIFTMLAAFLIASATLVVLNQPEPKTVNSRAGSKLIGTWRNGENYQTFGYNCQFKARQGTKEYLGVYFDLDKGSNGGYAKILLIDGKDLLIVYYIINDLIFTIMNGGVYDL